MKILAKKSLLFIIPFLVIIITELIIDPYNYFSEENNKELLEIKENISKKNNPYLYKLIQFDRKPCSTIIIGDSRTAKLSPLLFNNNENVANLAMGGGSLQDAIKIFWYISDKHIINKVYLGISIESYSGTLLRDRVTPSIEIKNSLFSYLLNRYTLEATILICKKRLFNAQIDLYKPPYSKEEFWKNQLDWASRYLKDYSYPKNYYTELKKIDSVCLMKNIKLVFVLSPTHIDLQKRISDFHLDNAVKRFKHDIALFGDVYDFNYPNIITNDRSNFSDPFHHNDSISRIIVNEISTNKIKYSKFTQHAINSN